MTTLTEKEILITRIFDAPRELVWKAWTDPKRFALWWGPKDFTAPHISIDLREGGRYVYCMRGPGLDGVARDFWNTGQYLEIVPMEKIVANTSFADENGNPVPASYYGMPGDWQTELALTVTFQGHGGKTIMTLHQAGIPDAMIKDCEAGWNESFDKLAESLK